MSSGRIRELDLLRTTRHTERLKRCIANRKCSATAFWACCPSCSVLSTSFCRGFASTHRGSAMCLLKLSGNRIFTKKRISRSWCLRLRNSLGVAAPTSTSVAFLKCRLNGRNLRGRVLVYSRSICLCIHPVDTYERLQWIAVGRKAQVTAVHEHHRDHQPTGFP